MSEKKAKQKRREEGDCCGECGAGICPCVIEHIREQENAMVVAKQALTSLDAMYRKATMERDDFMQRNEELTDLVKGKSQDKIDDKMREIDKQASRFALRSKIELN